MRFAYQTNLMLLAGLAFSVVAAASLEGQRGQRGGGTVSYTHLRAHET